MGVESYRDGSVPTPPPCADEVFEHIVTALMRGEIDPGEIIEETSLAQTLGVGASTINAVLERLEMRKLVERIPDVGARARGATLSELRELYEVRKALEGLACRVAAKTMSAWEIDDLEALVESQEHNPGLIAGTGQGSGLHEPDFHFLVICGSRNARLIELLCDEVYYQLRLFRSWSGQNRARQSLIPAEHREIVTALRARDGAGAEAAMRRHIERAYTNIVAVERWRLSPDVAQYKKYIM
jgi:DNA-binding GntR family transcriptional regulator